eukprot:2764665-Rhodomonas_salina.1
MSGTDVAYGGMGCAVLRYSLWWYDWATRDSVWWYGMCGTDVAYGGMGCAVLRQRMVVCRKGRAARRLYG